jgi:hypothetical protein
MRERAQGVGSGTSFITPAHPLNYTDFSDDTVFGSMPYYILEFQLPELKEHIILE